MSPHRDLDERVTEEFPPVTQVWEYDDDVPRHARVDEHDDVPAAPTRDDVLRARADERRATAEVVSQATALPRVLQAVDERGRRWGLVSLIVTVIVSVAVALAVSVAAYSNSADTRATVDQALAQLAEGNARLQQQGRPPVPTPDMPDPTETITAAVTAQVLASLPEAATADDVADRIEAAVVGSVIGPGRARLTEEIRRYFAVNGEQFRVPPITPASIDAAVARRLEAFPPAAGPRGERGERGEPCLPSNPACRGDEGPKGDRGDRGEQGDRGEPACPPPAALRSYEVLTSDGTVIAVLCVPAPTEGGSPS